MNGLECHRTDDDVFFGKRMNVRNGRGDLIGAAEIPQSGVLHGVNPEHLTSITAWRDKLQRDQRSGNASCTATIKIPISETSDIYEITLSTGEEFLVISHQELVADGVLKESSP